MEEGQGTHKALSLVPGILSKEIFLPSKSHEPPLMHRRLLGRLASSVFSTPPAGDSAVCLMPDDQETPPPHPTPMAPVSLGVEAGRAPRKFKPRVCPESE